MHGVFFVFVPENGIVFRLRRYIKDETIAMTGGGEHYAVYFGVFAFKVAHPPASVIPEVEFLRRENGRLESGSSVHVFKSLLVESGNECFVIFGKREFVFLLNAPEVNVLCLFAS